MTKQERIIMTDKLIEMLNRIDEINTILSKESKSQVTTSACSSIQALSSKEEILRIKIILKIHHLKAFLFLVLRLPIYLGSLFYYRGHRPDHQ